jgi:hypothetical protein
MFIVSGVGTCCSEELIFLTWKDAISWVVPLFLGGRIGTHGNNDTAQAVRLGRYLQGKEGLTPEMAVQFFSIFTLPAGSASSICPTLRQRLPRLGKKHD